MGKDFFSNKVAANQKIDRAKKEADLYAAKKMQGILDELNNLLQEAFPEEAVLAGTWRKIDKLIGSQIALAHGVGFMLGLEKRKLYNASGNELL